MSKTSQVSARKIREIIIQTAYHSNARGCHFGGALSCVDFISVILDQYKINELINPQSARIILSKGHACLSLYALLNHVGHITDAELNQFENEGSTLAGHPIRDVNKQIYFSTGSLGIGLANAVGQALYFQRKYHSQSPKIIAIVGDGETNEGIVYESLCIASKYELKNLIVFIDNNKFQQTGSTKSISGKRRLDLLVEACGANVIKISDGNNHNELEEALKILDTQQFTCIIGDTIKGKGISFMEENNQWHHNKLTNEEYIRAIKELEL